MRLLDETTFDAIVALFVPQMSEIAARQSLVTQALYDAPMLIEQLTYEGSAQAFSISLVRNCDQFGQIAPGRLALVAVLAQLREQVENAKQLEIDRITANITQIHTATPFEFEGETKGKRGKHLFISYSRVDLQFVQQLIRDLQARDVQVWIDKIGLKPGTPDWENALRNAIKQSDGVVLVASPASRQSTYVRDEIAIAQAAQRPVYPVWAKGTEWSDCIAIGLGYIQYVDLRDSAYKSGLAELVSAVRGETTIRIDSSMTKLVEYRKNLAAAPDFVPRNPYKGLRAFQEQDSGDFFGRDGLIDELVSALNFKPHQSRFLAVVGASGSGKSSVIMAGLLPKLKQGILPGSENWHYLDPIVPGTYPLENLTTALAGKLSYIPSDIRRELDNPNKRGLHTLAKQVAKNSRLVLYIDQFEELFTLTTYEAERRQFIDLLTTAVTEPDGALIVVLSMRADFYDRPLEYNTLGNLIKSGAIPILPLNIADLYEVIGKPTQLEDVQITFEDGLITEILFAVRDEIGALPLLQFTLDQLFQRRDGRHLTHAAYAEIGGVRGALTQHAEQTYHALPSHEHRHMARALFLRLIEPGVTEQDTTRRRTHYAELTLPNVEQTRILQQTADIFVKVRLLTSDQNHAARTIEVSHEALIREWQRLGEWLHDAREDVRLQKSLAADVAEWQRRGKLPERLYRGAVLTDALAWAERNAASRDEMLFLHESQRAERERQYQEVRMAARVRNLWRLVGVIIAIASVGLLLIFAQNNANLQAEAATLQSVASTANFQSGYVQAQVNWLATRQFPLAPVELTQTPAAAFFATATMQANIAQWQPETKIYDGSEFVLVPAGCFWMGSNSGETHEYPMHEQCFEEPYWIGKTEVTNAEYAAFMAAGGYDTPDYWTEAGWAWRTRDNITQPDNWNHRNFNTPQQPVISISWYEAIAYTHWRGCRLPTEAEWEYAARGPNGLTYPWGNDWLPDNTVNDTNSDGRSKNVGSYPQGASWVGALDMSGNAWEWVNSAYMEYPYRADGDHENITNADIQRVLRGGSWNSSYDNSRATLRLMYAPFNRFISLGLRVVCPV